MRPTFYGWENYCKNKYSSSVALGGRSRMTAWMFASSPSAACALPRASRPSTSVPLAAAGAALAGGRAVADC
eukprot:191866-Prymnesium_polylepis.1